MNNNNQNKERTKRIRTLILIVTFIGLMVIIATYAWFSTQKNVEIANITGSVQVVEGLEISLNAKDWGKTINLATANLDTDSYNVTVNGVQIKNTNHKPTEYIPASTAGTAGDKIIKLFRGTALGEKLYSIQQCNESQIDSTSEEYAGYYAFDIFLRDSSQNANAINNLYITNTSSIVYDEPGKNVYGTLNCLRLGIAQYATVDASQVETTTGYSASQSVVLTNTVANEDSKISKVAIWEPNSNYHINTIINSFVTNGYFKSTEYNKFGLTDSGLFGKTTVVDTYALIDNVLNFNESSKGGDEIIDGAGTRLLDSNSQQIYGISNVYNWSNESRFVKQNTIKTKISVPDDSEDGTEVFPSSFDITGVADTSATSEGKESYDNSYGALLVTTDGDTITIPANTIVRYRIYLWLEGQDVDTLNYASHGGSMTVNLGIQKPASSTQATSQNSEHNSEEEVINT